LEAAEIESIVSADDAGGMRPSLWMGGVLAIGSCRDAETCGRLVQSK